MADERTLAELAGETGVPARTIRFYIARGLVEGPAKAGRGAVYTQAHVDRVEKIKALQSEGRHLTQIAALLEDPRTAAPRYESAPWWQHAIAEDVVVMTRGDASPWRQKQIREVLDEMARKLRRTEK